MGLVDAGEEHLALLPRRLGAGAPGLGDQLELRELELGDRAHVLRRVDDYLLVLEGRVLVRHDAHLPARRVRRTVARQREQLGRGALLAALAKRARGELLVRDRL